MNKGYLVGGLAIVGAIALFAYLMPKGARRNSDGFFGASGGRLMSGGGSMNRPTCKRCRDTDTGGSYQNWNGTCDSGDTCIQTRY